ncbi:MAG: hypothetical protein JWM83_2010 [Candidatus Angelobacter sp.]|nr:hypothetical protein [Candidatus Angelobacter sp.]
MSRTTSLPSLSVFIVVLSLLSLPGCGSKNSNVESRVEKPIAATPTPLAQKSPEPPPSLPPPTKAEVEAAFQRIFGDTLVAERGTAQFFIVGDFNGDQSEDLAIIARPAPGKLDDVNSELSNWIIEDADKAVIPTPNKKVVSLPKAEAPKIEKDEEVLAIIHGFGPKGWRNPDARQAYLVKHAAATFQGIAPSISQKAIRAMKLPFATDIIKEVRNNKRGFLFWTGSMYAWHPSEG